jgi:hypothetical protein
MIKLDRLCGSPALKAIQQAGEGAHVQGSLLRFAHL